MLTTHYMDEAEKLCDRIAVVDHGRVIAEGTPRELIRSLGGDHVIEIAVEEGGPGGLRPEDLADLPSVRAVHAEAGHLVLTVAEPHVAIAPLLERVASRGFRAREPRHPPRQPRGRVRLAHREAPPR